jgi:transposase-like protein
MASGKRKEFTDEEKRVAVADLANMTIEQAAKKHRCSASSLWAWKRDFQTGTSKPRAARRSTTPGARTVSLEHDQERVAELEQENQRLRRLLLDGFIVSEHNPKLRRIAQIVRDAGKNQIQEIMETLFAPETPGVPPRTDDPEAASENSMGHKRRAR